MRLLQRLPAILELHNLLRSKYHRRISRHDAKRLTLRDLKQQLSTGIRQFTCINSHRNDLLTVGVLDGERKLLTRLVGNLSFVWSQVRTDIFSLGGLPLPYC